MEINKIIKLRRTELGLTLKDVADALDIAESTVSRYESSDIQHMGIDKIESLAKVLQCSPGYLMGWESDQPHTIAAHFDGDEYTADELDEIKKFAAYVKSRRNEK